MVRFIDTTVSNATGKEGTGSPCHDVATEIHKIFSVDTSNQILIECEALHFLPKSILAKLRNRMVLADFPNCAAECGEKNHDLNHGFKFLMQAMDKSPQSSITALKATRGWFLLKTNKIKSVLSYE